MKFKNIKKKASSQGEPAGKKEQSPNNSRTITERFKISLPKLTPARLLKLYRGSLKIFIVIIFIFTAIIVGLDLQENIFEKRDIDIEREKLMEELIYWKAFVSKNPNYRDAYFALSIAEYKLGNALNAKMYVKKGLDLDPSSENGKKLEEFLSK